MLSSDKIREKLGRPEMTNEEAEKVHALLNELATMLIDDFLLEKWKKDGEKGPRPEVMWI